MTFDSQNFSYVIAAICIFSFKYFVLFLFPFKELMHTIRARGTENAEVLSKLESLEKTLLTLLPEKINSNQADVSNTANNTSTDASTSNVNTSSNTTDNNASISSSNNNNNDISTNNAASTSANAATKATFSPSSSPSSSSSYSSTEFDANSSSHESLTATVKHIREQSIKAALHLADKIDELKQENQALSTHIVALQNQLVEEKSQAGNISHTMANRIDILERYVENDSKLEDQRKHEVQEVQLLSQKNTDLINERINTVEDQLTKSFKEFEDRRSKGLQSLASAFKSLKRRCDDLKVELDQQIQVTAKQAKETAMNAATIKETFASNALANLGNTVREAMDLCESKLNKVEAEREPLLAAVEGTSQDIKIVHERVVALEIEFDNMRAEVRGDLAEMNGSIGSMKQYIHYIRQEVGAQQHGAFDDTGGKSSQEIADITDETF